MPLYDVQCTECDHIQEQVLKREEDPHTCEKCGSKCERLEVQRGSGFALRGSGWYADGY